MQEGTNETSEGEGTDIMDILSEVSEQEFGDGGESTDVDTPETSEDTTDESDSEETTESDDIPNIGIRFNKANEKIAKLEGQIETLMAMQKEPKDEETDEDSEEYLTEEEQREQDRDSKIEELQGKLNKIEKDKITLELKKKDNAFYESNPHLKKDRAEHSKKILAYIRSKPGMARDVYEGHVTLNEVHLMMGGKTSEETQDPKSVFGSKKKAPTSSRKSADTTNIFDDAINVLGDGKSTNKREAVDAIEDSLAEMFL